MGVEAGGEGEGDEHQLRNAGVGRGSVRGLEKKVNSRVRNVTRRSVKPTHSVFRRPLGGVR